MIFWPTSFLKVLTTALGFPQNIPKEILNFESLWAVRAQHSNSNSGKRAPWNPQRFSLAAFHYSGCHSSERNDTPEAQGDRSVTSHLDTWAESATPIIDRWRPCTGYSFSEDIFSPKLNMQSSYVYSEKTFKKSPNCFDTTPERIYNSHYGNGVPAMFTS